MILIIQMILVALAAVAIYLIIGFIPGTDETSVLVPISFAVILMGTAPILVLTFFIASIVTLNLTNLIPTALVGLPGGVLASPMVEPIMSMENENKTKLIQKIAASSLVSVMISVPLSLLLANLLAPFGEQLKDYSAYLFIFGAIFLSLMSKNKILSLISIPLLSILFMSLRHLYWGLGIIEEGKVVNTSFFLGITIGPLIMTLLHLLGKSDKAEVATNKKQITIQPDQKGINLNLFKTLSKEELKHSSIAVVISHFLFFLSPVGLIILLSQMGKKKNKKENPMRTVTTMSALAQSTYLSGIIIPLLALGIPLSPTAIGPGNALFNAEPIFTLDRNIHHILSTSQFVLATVVGALVAASLIFYIVSRYANTIAKFVLTKIPHEAVLSLFISLLVLLSFMDAGLINVLGVLLIGVVCGTLNKMGVNYGVQFMTLYVSSSIIQFLMML